MNNQAIKDLERSISRNIIGQERLIERMLIALLADGHLLVEGAPGLAKTTAIKELSLGLEGDFHRVQFTPDLLPGDITGTDIYRPQDGSFIFQQGPIFHNFVLADEINRAPAKVQSALLEAMAERQVTVGGTTYPLSPLFLVMATQNPIEQEGTYPLPEAQLDRFLMHVTISYPSADSEQKILHFAREQARQRLRPVPRKEQRISQQELFRMREEVLGVFVAPALEEYMVQLVIGTREPGRYGDDLARWVNFGASPRGTIALDRCAKAHAWLQGKDFVAPENIHAIAHDVLRHRVLLSFEAEAEGVAVDAFLEELMRRIAVP